MGRGGVIFPLELGNGTGTPPIIPCTIVLKVAELESEMENPMEYRASRRG